MLDLRMLGCQVSRYPGILLLRVPRPKNRSIRISGTFFFRIPGYLDTWIPGYLATWILRYPDTPYPFIIFLIFLKITIEGWRMMGLRMLGIEVSRYQKHLDTVDYEQGDPRIRRRKASQPGGPPQGRAGGYVLCIAVYYNGGRSAHLRRGVLNCRRQNRPHPPAAGVMAMPAAVGWLVWSIS